MLEVLPRPVYLVPQILHADVSWVMLYDSQ